MRLTPRHAELIVKNLDLEKAEGVTTPGTKEEGRTKDNNQDALDPGKASEYHAIVARINYLAADRPDIAFAVKEAAREMSNPTIGAWDRFKRIGKYLSHRPRMVIDYRWQHMPSQVCIYTDVDWAWCKQSRKSASGGRIVLGYHSIKTGAKPKAS